MLKSFSGLWPSVSNIAPLATCDCYTINSLTDHNGTNALVLSNLHYDIVCVYTTNSISAHTSYVRELFLKHHVVYQNPQTECL